MGTVVIREMTITNERGLHARASAAICRLCEKFEAPVIIRFNGEEADGRSIMDLMILAATQGSMIEVEATGDDAEALMDALEEMIAGKFGEWR